MRDGALPKRRPQILGIGGTNRSPSTTEFALAEALRAAEEHGASTRLFGGGQLAELPIFDPAAKMIAPVQAELLEALAEADGLIIASPGYHGAISGVLKNAIDTLELARTASRPYLSGLPVGIVVTVGGWQAAGTALVTMRTIVHALRGWPTPFGATLNTSEQQFDAGGNCKSEKDLMQLATVAAEVLEFANMRMSA